MPVPYRPQAVGLECPKECEQKILDGACLLKVVPGFSKIKIHESLDKSQLAVSFHAEGKTPSFKTWHGALSNVLGGSVTESLSKETIAEFFVKYKALLSHHGRCYSLQDDQMVEIIAEEKTPKKRCSDKVAPPLEVQRPLVTPTISPPARSSPRERIVRPNEQGVMEPVVVRQARLELTSIPEPPPAVAESAVAAVTPVKPAASRDIFKQGDYDASILPFLRESRPFTAPAAVQKQGKGEHLRAYLTRYLKAVNGPGQHGTQCIFKLLPRVLKDKDGAEGLSDALSAPGVGPVLQSLRGFMHAGMGKGFWLLFPQLDMQAFNYKFPLKDGSVDIKGSECFHLEALRRALRFEKGIGDIARDIYELLQRSFSLECVSENAQSAMRLMLEFGCGRLGDGPAFFTAPPADDPHIRRLRLKDSAQDPVIADVRMCLETLRSDRQYAFNSLYPVCSGLCWIWPTLAFLHLHRDLLGDLNSEASVSAFQKALVEEWAQRKAVYGMALSPLLKYGATLNRLYIHLRTFAQAFRELEKGQVDLSRHPKVISIDKYGNITGRDMRKIDLGHFDPSAPSGLLPFDQELAGLRLKQQEEAQRIAKGQLSKEAGWIAAMLDAYSIPCRDCPSLACMLKARERCSHILENDSWSRGLSRVLAPTASMPDAVFDPEAVYL